ncbi:unnamed protein product [Porites lobata]|uniref:FHA domain-containing protein n=1 Tax=Porites lobata TaxID=104759 RepID=A0ABN8NK09_9CNID|nr:unnamed protein product [Porites lobata]
MFMNCYILNNAIVQEHRWVKIKRLFCVVSALEIIGNGRRDEEKVLLDKMSTSHLQIYYTKERHRRKHLQVVLFVSGIPIDIIHHQKTSFTTSGHHLPSEDIIHYQQTSFTVTRHQSSSLDIIHYPQTSFTIA